LFGKIWSVDFRKFWCVKFRRRNFDVWNLNRLTLSKNFFGYKIWLKNFVSIK
jgi:hypothetical protein